MRLCGATCRTATIVLAGGEVLEVRVSGATNHKMTIAKQELAKWNAHGN